MDETLYITLEFNADNERSLIEAIENDNEDLEDTLEILNDRIEICFRLEYLAAKIKRDTLFITANLYDTSSISLSELLILKENLNCIDIKIGY